MTYKRNGLMVGFIFIIIIVLILVLVFDKPPQKKLILPKSNPPKSNPPKVVKLQPVLKSKIPTFDEFCPPLDPSKQNDYKLHLTTLKDPNNPCRALLRLDNPMCVYTQDYFVNGYGGLGSAVGTKAGLGSDTICQI